MWFIGDIPENVFVTTLMQRSILLAFLSQADKFTLPSDLIPETQAFGTISDSDVAHFRNFTVVCMILRYRLCFSDLEPLNRDVFLYTDLWSYTFLKQLHSSENYQIVMIEYKMADRSNFNPFHESQGDIFRNKRNPFNLRHLCTISRVYCVL